MAINSKEIKANSNENYKYDYGNDNPNYVHIFDISYYNLRFSTWIFDNKYKEILKVDLIDWGIFLRFNKILIKVTYIEEWQKNLKILKKE